jgi:hypothetical protein
VHVDLDQMNLTDARFTQHQDEVAPGVAESVHDSIVANAARHG